MTSVAVDGSYMIVMDPAVRVPETECFNNIVNMSKLPVQYHLPAMMGMEGNLELTAAPAGIIIFGSGASVYDPLPWQTALISWLEPLVLANVPILGLCYGHQLLAHMFGGKVDFLFPDKRKLRGLVPVHLDPYPRWGEGERTGDLIITHCEGVTEVPQCMQACGRSDELENYALAHKTHPIWSFQPHPEAVANFLEHSNIPPVADAQAFKFGHELVKGFLDYCYQQKLS